MATTAGKSEEAMEAGEETALTTKIDVERALKELSERRTQRAQMRKRNLDALHRSDEEHFAKKDSSMKKNTAFVKKLKTLSESQRDALIKDFHGLNLTKSDFVLNVAVTMCSIICATLLQIYRRSCSKYRRGENKDARRVVRCRALLAMPPNIR